MSVTGFNRRRRELARQAEEQRQSVSQEVRQAEQRVVTMATPALEDLKLEDLRRLATEHGISYQGVRKDDLVELVRVATEEPA